MEIKTANACNVYLIISLLSIRTKHKHTVKFCYLDHSITRPIRYDDHLCSVQNSQL